MKIVKFRIENYKSIVNSGICYLDDNITILAGKNEAGKTAIVEALENFNYSSPIPNTAIPINNSEKKPKITIWIKLDEDELELLRKDTVVEIKDNNLEIKIVKEHPVLYTIGDDFFKKIENKNIFGYEDLRSHINEIKSYDSNFMVDKDLFHKPLELQEYVNKEYKISLDVPESQKIKIGKLLPEFNKRIKDCLSFHEKIQSFILHNFCPNFILFSSFEDIIPKELPTAEIDNSPIIKDLSKISNLDINRIKNPIERFQHREELNLELNEDYSQFWTQDNSLIVIEIDPAKLHIFVKEGMELYPPEIRSKGKQWHLAFYIRLTARSIESDKNVLLIDEPGLFLHANAQNDILVKLEECSKRNQVIFTTHSPYLITPDKLNRVRLVIKARTERKSKK